MTGGEWVAWAALAVFGCLYAAGATVAAIFSGSVDSPQGSVPSDATGGGTPTRPPGTAAVAGGRGLALFAAVGASFSLALVVHTTSQGHAWQYAATGAAMLATLAALHLVVGAAPVRTSRRIRRLMQPVARSLAWCARIPGIAIAAGQVKPPDALTGSAPNDVTAALAQNLERIERSGLDGDHGELRMIKAVLSMDTARVREIMRPRVDMVAARADATPEQLAEIINDRGHSKIPVYAETIDEIVGVVYARDLLRLQNGNGQGPKTAREIARPAIFVPESQRLEQLLREFQRHRTQIAIVVDEYGGVSGMVTVQDLIEEIVGEIVDEFDRNEPDVERISESEATMDARLPIDSFNEMFGVKISPEGFDTVGGLVYRELGKMPVVGDTIDVQNLRIAVESTMGRRIRRLRVKRIQEMSDSPV